ncbi:MAG: hypothetical protein HY763_02835 [Planctomycetes bacterium]|nr:hypothetical protein [Planctomycetota bacterium]
MIGALMSPLCMGGCPGPNPPGGQSDVPCFEPVDWAVELARFVSRPDAEGSAVLLLTVQSLEDARTDAADEHRDYSPHRAVYRFNPADETVDLVDDDVWDQATGAISECCAGFVPEPPFDLDESQLYFNGRAVEVAGGSVLAVSQAPSDRVVAALSTNGRVSFLFQIASGQHYHQLFSRATGEPVGPSLRLAVGGFENGGVLFDWTPDERYVVYEQGLGSTGNRGIGLVCIVPVAEVLATLETAP